MKHIIFIFAICLGLSGCFINKEPAPIVFDNSEPLSLIPDVNWAVIKDPYAALRENASWESSVKVHCRRGEIFQITGNKTVVNPDGIAEKWLLLENAWVPESCVSICYNHYNALTVSKELTK